MFNFTPDLCAGIELNWDDPLCVGHQQSQGHGGPWCMRCATGNAWTRVPLMGLVGKLPICWWCGGPMGTEKPTRTHQDTDRTVANTTLEPSPAMRAFWAAEVWGDWGDAA